MDLFQNIFSEKLSIALSSSIVLAALSFAVIPTANTIASPSNENHAATQENDDSDFSKELSEFANDTNTNLINTPVETATIPQENPPQPPTETQQQPTEQEPVPASPEAQQPVSQEPSSPSSPDSDADEDLHESETILEPVPAPELTAADIPFLSAASITDQIVTVEAYPGTSSARLCLYEKTDDGEWIATISDVSAHVGRDGVGQAHENIPVTPAGTYPLPSSFGINPSPGTSLPYVQVDDTHWWVSDPLSPHYNRLVSTRDTTDFDGDWGEHLIEIGPAYAYAIEIGYNLEATPRAGSAFFLHCYGSAPYTQGCVAVPENIMVQILLALEPGAQIVIGDVGCLY